jgi:transposase-like protein
MSKYTEEQDSEKAICPYCGNKHHVEAESYDASAQEEECDNCGKKYWLQQEFDITHNTAPDCELNGEEHQYELMTFRTGFSAHFCSECGKVRPK